MNLRFNESLAFDLFITSQSVEAWFEQEVDCYTINNDEREKESSEKRTLR